MDKALVKNITLVDKKQNVHLFNPDSPNLISFNENHDVSMTENGLIKIVCFQFISRHKGDSRLQIKIL